ncbi:MAG: hypothetical protein CM15mP74_30860 [Halieaceae bacterium]|nr:MAG: hypothetical protein CM15mP74_30860 [Halieaceae bacterium]
MAPEPASWQRGRAYYDFVHAENLSADELIASSETSARKELYRGLSEEETWLADRLRDIHDLQHVMTGYGRDPVGELSLLSFMTTQTPTVALISSCGSPNGGISEKCRSLMFAG